MKNIAERMHDFDRENMRRMAYGLPELQDEEPRHQMAKVAEIVNDLFRQLRGTFPLLASKSQEDLDEMRRQWLVAFKENGITTLEQINAGMRAARRQEKPFLPSPGQFVAWCRAEESAAVGLPDVSELVGMVYQYGRTRGFYPDAESYPWQHNAHYWLVTTLYQRMRSAGLTDSELCKSAADELAAMVRRIRRGEKIPEPVARLPVLGGKPLTREQSMSRVQEIREKFGLKGGRV